MREPEHENGGGASLNAMLGPGSVVEGKLSFEGQVGIEGTFTGEISTKDLLVIGASARVSADITCGSLVVKGEVNGNIHARESVELREHARVKADISTPALTMDKGVLFDGKCTMGNGRSEGASPRRRPSPPRGRPMEPRDPD